MECLCTQHFAGNIYVTRKLSEPSTFEILRKVLDLRVRTVLISVMLAACQALAAVSPHRLNEWILNNRFGT